MFIFDPAQGRIKRPRGLEQIRERRVIFFSIQNLVKSKKKSSRPQMSNFSHKIKCRERKKKVNTSASRSFSRNFPKFSCEHDLTCFHCSKCRNAQGPPKCGVRSNSPVCPLLNLALIRPSRGSQVVFDSVVQEGRLFLALFDLDRKGDSTGV